MCMCKNVAVCLHTRLIKCVHKFSGGQIFQFVIILVYHQIRFILFFHVMFPPVLCTCNHAHMHFSLCVCVFLKPCESWFLLIKGAIDSLIQGWSPCASTTLGWSRAEQRGRSSQKGLVGLFIWLSQLVEISGSQQPITHRQGLPKPQNVIDW